MLYFNLLKNKTLTALCHAQIRSVFGQSVNEDRWLCRKNAAARCIPELPVWMYTSIYLNAAVSESEPVLRCHLAQEASRRKFTWVHLSHFDIPPLYTGGDTCLGLSAICLLCPCILLSGCMRTLHQETDKEIYFLRQTALPLMSWDPRRVAGALR